MNLLRPINLATLMADDTAIVQHKVKGEDCTGGKKPLADDTIRDAVRDYSSQNCTTNSTCAIGDTYGWPINTWCVSEVTNMRIAFDSRGLFNDDISDWDVSRVTTMRSMFYDAYAFNGDLSKWDVSRVTNMEEMFYLAWAFNGDLSKWDVSRVTSMRNMFRNTRDFDGDLSSWDVSRVTKMAGMFRATRDFDGDLSSWDVSKVTDMSRMFYQANAFNGDLSSWDISRMRTMSSMFHRAKSFNTNLCEWGDKFPYDYDRPYDLSWRMFADSGCTFKDDPERIQRGPFCASSCAETHSDASSPILSPVPESKSSQTNPPILAFGLMFISATFMSNKLV